MEALRNQLHAFITGVGQPQERLHPVVLMLQGQPRAFIKRRPIT